MDISHKNRQINLLRPGDLLMHMHELHGPVIYEFLEGQRYIRGKPYAFLVRDIFLITRCGTRALLRPHLQSDKVIFITEDSKEFKAIKVLYGKKE